MSGNFNGEPFDRKSYIVAAKDLGYSYDVIKQLEHADGDIECTRIMATAREQAIKKERGFKLCRKTYR